MRSEIGLYHLIFRGINKQNIFEEEKDYQKLKEFLVRIKQKLEFKIYAYVLMPNHVHMIFQEKEAGNITIAMHKLLTTYAGWYNKKYSRSGSLFGDRFNSKPINEEKYLFSLTRYIHQNPLRAGIVTNLHHFKWSSFQDYLSGTDSPTVLTDTTFILGYLSANKEAAIQSFISLHDEIIDKKYELGLCRRMASEEIRARIIKILDGKEPHTIASLPKHERNPILKRLREEGFSIRQIERATGISRGIIANI